MKKIIAAVVCVTMVLAMTLTAFAGAWEKDARGYRWKNDDGTYATNGWKWIDGNNDGKAECYYFSDTGYAVTSARTPDGYYVNTDGAWIVNQVVQQLDITKAENKSATSPSTSKNVATNAAKGTAGSGTKGILVDAPDGTKSAATVQPFLASLEYKGVDGTEKATITTDGENIYFNVVSGKSSAQLTPAKAEAMYFTEDHYVYMQKMINNLMYDYGESLNLVETITTSDGQTVYTYTYYGDPFEKR